MQHLLSLGLFVFFACGDGEASSPVPHPSMEGLQSEADSAPSTEVDAAADAIHQTAERLAQLPPEKRAQAMESLRILSVSCPYTRSALQVPFALSQAAGDIDAEGVLSGQALTDWRSLVAGLLLHTETLERLGVDLSVPTGDDALAGQAPGVLTDRQALMASPSPLALTQTLLRATPRIAAASDPETRRLIEEHSTRVEEATGVIRPCPRGPWSVAPGHPWTLGEHLNDWHDGLRAIHLQVADGPDRQHIGRMIALLDDYVEMTHAHP